MFNFTTAMDRLCRDMVRRLPELAHIDMDRVGVGFRQTRQVGHYGVHASLTPLRFQGGTLTKKMRGQLMTTQKVLRVDGAECLYLLQFYLPRFTDEPFEEKLATTVHELWHIGPQFDGDIRRFAGKNFAHGNSKDGFHQTSTELARKWLALDPPVGLYAFLQHKTPQLEAEYGRIVGAKYSTPKLVPVRLDPPQAKR
jgi:hypothetical protein